MSKLTTAPNLSPKQVNALTSLAAGNSVTDAAKAADVHRSTLPEFREALEDARRQHAEATQDRLAELAESALDTIRHLMEDPSTPPAVRLRAALAVLKQAELVRTQAVEPKPAPSDLQASVPEAQLRNEPRLESAPEAPIARNAACPCGSGLKYKRCCGTQALPQQKYETNPSPAPAHCLAADAIESSFRIASGESSSA